jgi:hypothetical protein
MVTKVEAARIATGAGIPVLLTSAANAAAALGGETVGTTFHATGRRRPTRLLWLAHASTTKGRVHLDAGAVRALTLRKASLLPAGITAVGGTFSAGDPIDMVGPDDVVIARGIVNYDSAELPALLGRSTTFSPVPAARAVSTSRSLAATLVSVAATSASAIACRAASLSERVVTASVAAAVRARRATAWTSSLTTQILVGRHLRARCPSVHRGRRDGRRRTARQAQTSIRSSRWTTSRSYSAPSSAASSCVERPSSAGSSALS